MKVYSSLYAWKHSSEADIIFVYELLIIIEGRKDEITAGAMCSNSTQRRERGAQLKDTQRRCSQLLASKRKALGNVNTDVENLIEAMESAIRESDAFIL